MTAGQLASYDEFKKLLLKTGLVGDMPGDPLHRKFHVPEISSPQQCITLSRGYLTVDVHPLMYVKRES
jgi:hypothetical protein